MTVTDCLISNSRYNIEQDKVDKYANQLSPVSWQMFTSNVAINSSANVLEQDGQRVVSGSASEIALIEFILKMQIDVNKFRKEESVRFFSFSFICEFIIIFIFLSLISIRRKLFEALPFPRPRNACLH